MNFLQVAYKIPARVLFCGGVNYARDNFLLSETCKNAECSTVFYPYDFTRFHAVAYTLLTRCLQREVHKTPEVFLPGSF
nr:MAG TPA: hypothetical protein [Caudoviricetes sp.]